MQSQKRCAASYVLKQSPTAVVTHCCSHNLNLLLAAWPTTKHSQVCCLKRQKLRGLHINAILISWEKRKVLFTSLLLLCVIIRFFKICVITVCNLTKLIKI